MHENENTNEVPQQLLWIPRIMGAIWVIAGLTAFIGYTLEGIEKNGGSIETPRDLMGVVAAVSVLVALAGLVVAYWQIKAGALISLGGFVVAGIMLLIDPKLHFSAIMFFFAVLPSLMYLSYWWLSAKSSGQGLKE